MSDPHLEAPSQPTLHITLGYAVTLAAAVVLFLLIRGHGETLTAPALEVAVHTARDAAKQSSHSLLLHVLLALAVVILTGRLLGQLFVYLGQPPILGEVAAGIVLGPSLLGHPNVLPGVSQFLLPADVAPSLGVLAQVGVILYMFLVGLELNPEVLRRRAHATVLISHVSIIVPFLMGAALALVLYPRFSHDDVRFTSFALFLGVALSVTAFPVLARILTDRGMQRSPLGIIALTCAAVDDVTAWCLLAFVVGVAQANVTGSLLTFGLALVYVAVMLFVVRPLLRRWLARYEQRPLTAGGVAVVLVALLLSALATEAIGIHALFGAFLLGAIIPHDSSVADQVAHKLEDLVGVLLLPAFFAFTGMRTQIGLVSGMEAWLFCGLIVLVATAGKLGGTLAAARWTGMGWREASALGVLMNTRGLMELIVLNVGLDLGVISPTMFAMLVLMALVTTLATTPILHWLHPQEPPATQPPRSLRQAASSLAKG